MTPRTSRGARLRPHAGVLALLLCATLAGCGGDDRSDSPAAASPDASASQPSGDATAGVEVSGSGYSLLAPPGWADTTAEVQARYQRVDVAAADPAVAGGFTDNVNVTVDDERRLGTQRRAERYLRRQLGLVSGDVRIQEPGELDGEVAYHATAHRRLGRVKVRTSQYLARHDKAWYLVTFSFGPQTDTETEAEEVQSMLDSWSWKD